MTRRSDRRLAATSLLALVAVVAVALPAGAHGSSAQQSAKRATALGKLEQLPGSRGCVADAARSALRCGTARALDGPGPFMGSRALALSPDGGNLYVAASRSDSIAVFARGARTGRLRQLHGAAGCVAATGADGCAKAVGLDRPNSVAVSPDGSNVYVTSRGTGSITSFNRDRFTGELSQSAESGCLAASPLPGCEAARAMRGADVVVVSPDGKNVYVGAFFNDAIASFHRNPSNGRLSQPAGAAGCIASGPSEGCGTGLALAAPEGLAVSADGSVVYVAGARSSSVVTLARDGSSGGLSEATDGSACIVDGGLEGCATGFQISGANAVALSPDDGNAYVTSLSSNSVTSFARSSSTPLTQNPGSSGCLVHLIAVGCSLGHALQAPEGVVVSPDGANVYAVAFESGSVVILDRDPDTGGLMQKPDKAGCLASGRNPDCKRARALRGAGSVAASPDGRYLYVTAFGSDAVAIFRRHSSDRHIDAR